MMFWYGGHWAFWQTGLMWVGMILFWGLLIWGIYALISNATRGPRGREPGGREPGGWEPRGREPGGDARRILDERLARGDIDAEEYGRLRDLIDSGHAGTPAKSGQAS